ncbi:MAG TPA: VOC family protein [Mycobacteriales bacterium]|nr:VOC family protein [Mycobacteriales bacterium]
MPEKSEYSPGSPCWIDVSSSDVEESLEFYSGLFGWEGQEQGPESGGYVICTLGGRTVAGIAPIMDDDHPPRWSVYVCTSDIDATTTAVKEAGGTVVGGPLDVFEAGRMAVFHDSTGGEITAWQPNQHHGSELVNEPNAWSWSELLGRDLDAAAAFYEAVFAWGIRRGDDYSEWQFEGQSIGGFMAMPEIAPVEVPPMWLPYIEVDRLETTTQRAVELGGSVRMPPSEYPGGRYAVINDVHGAGLGLLKPTPPD